YLIFFFISFSRLHLYLHSFPTRRSSDLFSNVLFLDAKNHSYLEELGGMNIFIVDDGVLKTPPLGDTILAGVTRDSILRLAKGLRSEEHTSELQSRGHLVCRLLLEKKKRK